MRRLRISSISEVDEQAVGEVVEAEKPEVVVYTTDSPDEEDEWYKQIWEREFV